MSLGYRVEVRDKDLNRIGEIDTWIKLDLVIRFCQQGTWQILVKDRTPQARLLQRGGGIIVWQDGVDFPVFTGQIEFFQRYWTVDQHTGVGSVFVGGKCDNKLAYSRLAFPDPSKPVGQQYQAKDSRGASGSAGEALWWELDHALGPRALPDRRVPGVDVGTNPATGDTVADRLRFDVLGAKLEEWCKNKNVGYRFVHDPDRKQIVLKVFKPQDKSKTARFSPELGNLREYTWTLTAPRVTRAIVACQGEGAERYIFQKTDAEAEKEWGVQVEQFIDRRDLPLKTDPATGKPVKAKADTSDAEFEAAKKAVVDAADNALKEGARNGNFQIYPIDTNQLKFGRDYFVGDLVTVAVDGEEYTDVVREVNISVEDGGRVSAVTPKIGEQGTGSPLNLYKTVFDMREKLRKLEARM
ncbi:siphovirus ReqiPepy6 Gp37-like family protein [Streptomyces eurocidicus]|uniref:siphovirus ReqiPepy6 Gp37-like family protein n=1 Tax=Streptomyces eurocidicus TaxID=66423 RepID=UPI001E497C34|nr:siphovirus ReqiPepy6 Gp37-like family protein [Streptomyces eurocidicus]